MAEPEVFSAALFEVLKRINAGVQDLAFSEFGYALESLLPERGWDSVELDGQAEIEALIGSRDFYTSLQLKPRQGDRIVLDEKIANLTRCLFAGLVRGLYPEAWVRTHFYFDLRGFYFLPRTVYFTLAVLTHFGGRPYRHFEPRQKCFERYQAVGYNDFMAANAEVDQALAESLKKILAVRGAPLLITLAGPTAAGKTEITARLFDEFQRSGKSVTTLEVDNFLLDRDLRDGRPIGKETTHFEIFKRSLEELLQGRKITIPRYDFLEATSSHAPDGSLKPGRVPLELEPAEVVFMEGNFPFQIDELASLVGLKIVYLTDDPIRLKRKWKRDIDYRKKYDPAYFRNRFFQTQFLRAEEIYRPLLEVCDLCVDTTGAALWATPELSSILAGEPVSGEK
jgi:uridine kinase